jgi:hypothetical protein
MPELKKEAKAKGAAKTATAKGIKAKPASAAKPKAKVKTIRASRKMENKAPGAEKKAKRLRSYTRKAVGAFADLLKKQAELEEIKKGAKAELKKEYDRLIGESGKIKAQYKGLFNESIESAPKAKRAGANKASRKPRKAAGVKPYTIAEVKGFVEQKKKGGIIKISGRRPKSIARMEDAYRQSEDAGKILEILNK